MTTGCKLYLTYRSEYLVLRDLCVGGRDRASSAWLPLHSAACSHLLGPVAALEGSPLVAAGPRVGERLCLLTQARRVVTGPIVAIEDATPRLLQDAERQWQSLVSAQGPAALGVDGRADHGTGRARREKARMKEKS